MTKNRRMSYHPNISLIHIKNKITNIRVHSVSFAYRTLAVEMIVKHQGLGHSGIV